MKYISTRAQSKKDFYTFEEIALSGVAPDGGLFVPLVWPDFQKKVNEWSNLSYEQLAVEVIYPFIGTALTRDELGEVIRNAYMQFETDELLPVKRLKNNLVCAELFHGPTYAFKDFAMQFLGQLFPKLLKKQNRSITILGATSGDTGSAALSAFKDKDNIQICILHPHKKVSEVQRRQMTTIHSSNVLNIALKGSFDDCQDAVKTMFLDNDFSSQFHLTSINSINWARIIAQTVYYIYLYLKFGKCNFIVPTGNFGNIYAGYVAKQCGIDIGSLTIATNKNDILHRFIQNNDLSLDEVAPSLSPSMDIQVSSNLERFLFDFFGRMSLKDKMIEFRKNKSLAFTGEDMKKIRKEFSSISVSDNETLEEISTSLKEYNYLADPHTATGLHAYRQFYPSSKRLSIVLGTAHPAKFDDAIKLSGNEIQDIPVNLVKIMSLYEEFTVCDASINDIKKCINAKFLG